MSDQLLKGLGLYQFLTILFIFIDIPKRNENARQLILIRVDDYLL